MLQNDRELGRHGGARPPGREQNREGAASGAERAGLRAERAGCAQPQMCFWGARPQRHLPGPGNHEMEGKPENRKFRVFDVFGREMEKIAQNGRK